MVGHNVSHAKNRLRRVFRPNLHPAKITVDGTTMRVRLCTKCLRQLKNKKLNLKSLGSLKSSEMSSIVPASTSNVAEANTASTVAAGLA